MGAFRWRFLLLGAAAFLLGGCSGSSSSHSLLFFRTLLSKSFRGLPRDMEVGCVDGQPIERYDSDTKRMVPLTPWMKQSLNEEYWKEQGQYVYSAINLVRMLMDRWLKYNNQSTSFHIFQCIYGCEFNGSCQDTRLFHRDAIDGRDVEQLWDESELGHHRRYFWVMNCCGWLQRHLSYMNRTARLAVKVAYKVGVDGTDTLICHAHGFYPKGVSVTWRKDGKVWEQDTLPGKVLPNSDWTYYTRLSVRIHPRDRWSYRCHVEHVNLTEPLDVAWEGTEPPMAWVTREAANESRETLICQADGFFPKEIKATWRKDGEVWEQETTSGDVVSHVNGTYHTWISIAIDPKDRGLYRCHVEHAGLQAPLTVAWEEPASVGPIVWGTLGAIAALLLVAGIIFYVRKQWQTYQAVSRATSTNNQESSNSSKSKGEDSHPKGQEEVCIPLQEERETTPSG